MNKIKVLYREPREAEYKEIKVFDDLDEYLKVYSKEDFVRVGYEKWHSLKIDDKTYYSYSGGEYSCSINFDDLFLTEECYKKLLKYCKKTYRLCEANLFRTQKNSNCRFTGDLASIQDVIDYMKDDEKSWLPQILEEIDEDILVAKVKIKDLENKIKQYENDKIKLYDEEYLKSNIEVNYTFDSIYYKSLKENK